MTTHTPLEILAQQALTLHQAEQAAQAEQMRALEQDRQEQAEHALLAAIREILSPAFLESIPPWSFEHRYSQGRLESSAFFAYHGYRWHLSRAGKDTWTIGSSRLDYESRAYYQMLGHNVPGAEVESTLLLHLGTHLEKQKREQQEQQAREALWAQEKSDKLQAEARYQAQQAQEAQEADATHERLTRQLEALQRAREQSRWHWPEGVAVEVYHLSYCTGSYEDGNGDASCDYAGGWTTKDHLDHKGRIEVQTSAGAEVVQLLPGIHRPVWTVYTFTCVEDLPRALCETVSVQVPGIVERRNRHLDGKTRLVEITDEAREWDEEWVSRVVGVEPVDWLKTYVDMCYGQNEE